eukprot:3140905-Pyramimonas_sp.AAC.1
MESELLDEDLFADFDVFDGGGGDSCSAARSSRPGAPRASRRVQRSAGAKKKALLKAKLAMSIS